MTLLNDILKGNDGKYSLKNLNAFISFLSGLLLCFIIVLCKIYGKDISIEIPTLLLTSSLGLSGISGWQNLQHYKVDAGLVDPAPPADVTVDNNTTVNVDKPEPPL